MVNMNAWLQNSEGKRFVVDIQLTIGRFADCHIVLNDSRVSRWHALIQRVGESTLWIVDYGSRNGVYVNGDRLAAPRPLRDGDEIRIGAHCFRFHQPTATKPRPLMRGGNPGDRTEAASDAYMAIGHAAVLLSASGTVQRMTAQARKWLELYFGAAHVEGELPDKLVHWLSSAGASTSPLVAHRNDNRLVVRWAEEQCLLLLVEEQSIFSVASLQQLALTVREAEVMRWMADGKTTPEIATILDTSPRTVEKHIEHIFEKLRVETRAAAVVRAMELLKTRH